MDADGNPTNLRKCTVEDCDRPFFARGMCARHYRRWYDGRRVKERRRPRLPTSFKVFTG